MTGMQITVYQSDRTGCGSTMIMLDYWCSRSIFKTNSRVNRCESTNEHMSTIDTSRRKEHRWHMYETEKSIEKKKEKYLNFRWRPFINRHVYHVDLLLSSTNIILTTSNMCCCYLSLILLQRHVFLMSNRLTYVVVSTHMCSIMCSQRNSNRYSNVSNMFIFSDR
jgi:hypothetical protein